MLPIAVLRYCGLSVLVMSSILLICAYRLTNDLASPYLPVGAGN